MKTKNTTPWFISLSQTSCQSQVANYLKRYKYQEMRGTEAGKAFEHYFFLELMAYKNLNEKRDNIYYWRTKEGYEVDFPDFDKILTRAA